MVSCEVLTGIKRTLILGTYLPPSNLFHLPDLEEALERFRYQDPIALGYLNADIRQAQNPRSHQVADLLMEFGLAELLHHFRQRWRLRCLNTWYQVRQGRLLRSRCDYNLGIYWRCLEMVGKRDVRNYSSDHFSLRARLLYFPTQCHNRYLQGLCASPLSLHASEDLILVDSKFQELKVLDPTPTPLNHPHVPDGWKRH